jgi:hypothetical protein
VCALTTISVNAAAISRCHSLPDACQARLNPTATSASASSTNAVSTDRSTGERRCR